MTQQITQGRWVPTALFAPENLKLPHQQSFMLLPVMGYDGTLTAFCPCFSFPLFIYLFLFLIMIETDVAQKLGQV